MVSERGATFAGVELISLGVFGIRRFDTDERGQLDVVGSPIALVGPNEAGKTSFLRALEYLNEAGEFDPGDLTRNGNAKAGVRARFVLDDADRREIAEAGGVGRPLMFIVFKRESGAIHSKLEPPLQRDLGLRRKAAAAVHKAADMRWTKDRRVTRRRQRRLNACSGFSPTKSTCSRRSMS